METATQPKAQAGQKTWMTWTGRVLSALPILFIVLGLVVQYLNPQQAAAGMARFGYTADRGRIILTLEIVAIILFLIPRTAVFGAIFFTGYFGGAVATHVRVADPGWPVAVICALCIWLGLYLREPRLRDLVPFRKSS